MFQHIMLMRRKIYIFLRRKYRNASTLRNSKHSSSVKGKSGGIEEELRRLTNHPWSQMLLQHKRYFYSFLWYYHNWICSSFTNVASRCKKELFTHRQPFLSNQYLSVGSLEHAIRKMQVYIPNLTKAF